MAKFCYVLTTSDDLSVSADGPYTPEEAVGIVESKNEDCAEAGEGFVTLLEIDGETGEITRLED